MVLPAWSRHRRRPKPWQARPVEEQAPLYRDWLAGAAAAHECLVHARVLMTNHVHLLVTPKRAESLPRMTQSLGRRYMRYINTTYQRTGTLWEGRYRAAPIDGEACFLACCRYLESNPVRAGMVAHPRDYAWSSYRAHALGSADPRRPTIRFTKLSAAQPPSAEPPIGPYSATYGGGESVISPIFYDAPGNTSSTAYVVKIRNGDNATNMTFGGNVDGATNSGMILEEVMG
jgi:REP element-mobilizing transposase RayT